MHAEAPKEDSKAKTKSARAAKEEARAAKEEAKKAELAAQEAQAALLAAKLESLPVRSGCYLFYDKNRACLYVGKAKSLRSRVRSYFQEGTGDDRYFIPILRKLVT